MGHFNIYHTNHPLCLRNQGHFSCKTLQFMKHKSNGGVLWSKWFGNVSSFGHEIISKERRHGITLHQPFFASQFSHSCISRKVRCFNLGNESTDDDPKNSSPRFSLATCIVQSISPEVVVLPKENTDILCEKGKGVLVGVMMAPSSTWVIG